MTIWQPDTSTVCPSDFRPLDEDLVENSRFTGEDWSDLDQTGATFDTCEIISPILDGVTWGKVRVVNSILGRVNCAQLQATDSSWERVSIENCRIGVLDLTEASLKNVEFIGCKIDYLNVRGARLSDIGFKDCSLAELDATNAELTRISFTSTSLEHLLVPQAKLSEVHLSGAELSKITGVSYLRGAIINDQQMMQLAPIFAEELGIKISSV